MEFVEKENTSKVILSEDPKIYTINNYLTDDECDHFIKISKPNLKRAYVSDTRQGTYSKGRTGSNHWLLHNYDEVTKRVGDRISSLIGIPLENAESYQVVHYDVSQKYDQHWDAYAKNESEKCLRCLKWGGQRMVTALLYLNNVEEGGGTSFPNLNIVSRAEKGKLLIFYNCIPGTNDVHQNTLHAGMPVLKGEKFAVNLWFREISMKKLYDFPFLKNKSETESIEMNVKESNVNDISNTSSENVIELNSTNQTLLDLKKYSEEPIIYGLSNVLSKEECEYILSKCTNGAIQNRGRKSYWIRNNDVNLNQVMSKLGALLNLKNNTYFENMNVMEYPEMSDHGCHFDSFDLTTERGKKFSLARGQRLYTLILLLNKNNDTNNGKIEFRNYNSDILLNQGDCLIYKNTDNENETLFQRNNNLEYAIGPCRNEKKYYAYIYLRQKNINNEEFTLDDVKKIDNTMRNMLGHVNTMKSSKTFETNEEIRQRLIEINKQLNMKNGSTIKTAPTKVEPQKSQEVKEEVPENYYNTLDKYYENVEKKGIIQPFDSLKSRRANAPLDLQTLQGLLKCRIPDVVPTGFKSILNKRNLEIDFKQDEYTPVVVNNVFTEEAQKLIQHYFHDTINNNKFAFGDKQSQRFKAYDDLMSRIMQYEALPLLEKITKEKLKPTYTYLSCYVKGSDLPAHTDRPECEFTVSFLIDKPTGCSWPIYVDKRKEPVKNRGRYREYVNSENIHRCIPVDCDAGGLMCFQGTDHIHFREKLEYDYYYISLLHYQIIK